MIYTDISLEFGKACEDLSWNHCASTPHRPETNGIAERAVRRVKEGTSAVLLQSGLDETWWAGSVECYCFLRNVQDLLYDGQTPYERRFGEPLSRPIIPFLSMVLNFIRLLPKTSRDPTNLSKSSFQYLRWTCFVRGENLAEKSGRVRNSCSKTQRKESSHAKEWRTFSNSFADGSTRLA